MKKSYKKFYPMQNNCQKSYMQKANQKPAHPFNSSEEDELAVLVNVLTFQIRSLFDAYHRIKDSSTYDGLTGFGTE